MSGAIWIAAKRKAPWWPSWTRWRRHKTALQTSGCAAVAERPLVLVGTYYREELLAAAEKEFSASFFAPDDAVFVRGGRPSESSWWVRSIGRVRELFCRELQPDSGGVHVPLDAAYVDEVLAEGGGFVLVGSITRFQQACEIIERTGGHIGRPKSAVA